MTTTAEEFIQDIVEKFPTLRPMLDEHVDDYDEILPHIFFGELTQWFQEQLARDPKSSEALALLRYLESIYPGAPEDVQNVIYVSFVENLDVKGAGVRMLGPQLRAAAEELGRT